MFNIHIFILITTVYTQCFQSITTINTSAIVDTADEENETDEEYVTDEEIKTDDENKTRDNIEIVKELCRRLNEKSAKKFYVGIELFIYFCLCPFS